MTEAISTLSGENKAYNLPNVTTNPILRYAKMQLQNANEQRVAALGRMESVDAEREKQKEVNVMLSLFNERYERVSATGNSEPLEPSDMEWCYNMGITLPGKPDPAGGTVYYNASEYKQVVDSVQGVLDSSGSGIQSAMVLIQDALGQYNAFIQGASSSIFNFSDLGSNVAKW